QCRSPMGSRMMKRWIAFPLTDKSSIEKRLDAVEELREANDVRQVTGDFLKGIGDFERMTSRIAAYRISPREVNQLRKALEGLPELRQELSNMKSILIEGIRDQINPCEDLIQRIKLQLKPDAPVQVAKGGVIAAGYDETLDDLRDLIENNQERLLAIQNKEISQTGITNLKIGFNNVFGYYLEVTNKYKDSGLVPESWVRKQTLTNSERYITSELKEIEDKILGAEDKILELEEKLYH